MFGKKKAVPQIDKEQLELIKTAQARVKQKKRLYIHFVVFLIGAVFLIILNTVIGVGEDVTLFVFITHKFMGKDWEQQQLDKLVSKQKERITQLEKTITKQDTTTSKSESEEEKKTKISTGLTIIVAAGENDAIGKDNKLIWHLSDDLKRFKALTSGHNIIMGRKTFESFPKPLPNRTHVVISRQKDYQAPEGVIIVNSLENAINATRQDNQSFVIGGGEIYKQAILLADKIEMTRVHESFDADTFFPKIDSTIWKEVSNTFHNKDENHEHSFSFITYERR